MTNLIDITDLSDAALDALLGVDSNESDACDDIEPTETLTIATIDTAVLATARTAIESCISETIAQSAGDMTREDVVLTHCDCEYIVDSVESVHGRKLTPAECDVIGISDSYALNAFDLED